MKSKIKEEDTFINEYAKIINATKNSTKNYTQKIFSTGIS